MTAVDPLQKFLLLFVCEVDTMPTITPTKKDTYEKNVE